MISSLTESFVKLELYNKTNKISVIKITKMESLHNFDGP